jgi:hypothetical protein
MWTTVPPAKSSVVIQPKDVERIPPPHTMCAIGAYTSTDHSARNAIMAGNLILSAVAPTIMQAVTRANMPWKMKNSISGIVSPNVL